MLSRMGQVASTCKCAAFTLVELLVVIAIISLLASLLLPTISTARAKAKQTQCASNMRQIYAALLLYAGDHEGRMWNAYTPANTSGSREPWYSQEVIGQYIDGTPTNGYGGLLLCPADRESNDTWGLEQDNDFVRGSYAFNAEAISWEDEKNEERNRPIYVRISQIARPAQCVLAGEGLEFSYPPQWPEDGSWEISYMQPWHSGGCHCLFVDGHITWFSVPQGWEDADVVYFYDEE